MNTKIKTLAASLLLAGCVPPLMCTEIGCLGGLSFGFEVDEPGTWTFELDLIEDATVIDTITCVGTLPLSDDADDGCDRSDAFLTLSGSELDPSQQSIAGLTLDNTTPEVVDVRVFLDDEERLNETFTPVYETFSPNGEECGPTCTSGGETLDL